LKKENVRVEGGRTVVLPKKKTMKRGKRNLEASFSKKGLCSPKKVEAKEEA